MDEIKKHPAKNETPCWQSQRLSNGYLQQECLDCEVFLSAPIPVSKQTAV
jgi:hypothetical protein